MIKLRIIRIVIPVILVVAGIIYYCWFDTLGIYFPKCPIKLLTGLNCPSCGTQRAFSALLHGHIIQALQYNWFMIFSVIYLFLSTIVVVYDINGRLYRFRKYLFGRTILMLYVTLYFLWFVVRNLLGV